MEGLVFLDFDGVICDSLLECLVSSWKAYHELYLKEKRRSVAVSLRRNFSLLRPYVRAGEDFILMQELIDTGTTVQSQEEFDAQLEIRSARTLELYSELFYAARSQILKTQRAYWIGLNRIYPHIKEVLPLWAAARRLYVLSTKRADFIREILRANSITIDRSRILSCGAREKRALILSTLDKHRLQRALFIDDQIDHLTSQWAHDPRIVGNLAAWGYVENRWLVEQQRVEVLFPDRFAGRLEEWLADR